MDSALEMEIQEDGQEGEDEGRVEPALGGRRKLDTATTEEHHGDPVVLAGIVPGTPGEVERNQERARHG
jgi:hypothetical protein